MVLFSAAWRFSRTSPVAAFGSRITRRRNLGAGGDRKRRPTVLYDDIGLDPIAGGPPGAEAGEGANPRAVTPLRDQPALEGQLLG